MPGFIHPVLRGTVAAIAVVSAASARADAVEAFYKNRQVEVIISGSPGSTYDIGTRLVARHMARFIPGAPTMVPKGMFGGGHMIAANYLYNVAAKDGSVIGSLGETIPMAPFLMPDQAKFDAGKFNWIGNSQVTTNTLFTWHGSNVRTLEDAKKREVMTGATGAASPSSQVPIILNNLLGTRFKVITGYTAGQIEMAMERGELDARGSSTLGRLKSIRADWTKAGKIHLLFLQGLKGDPDFPNVPLLIDFARNEAERQVFKFISASSIVGRPILAPPGVPADRVKALRDAFERTMTDKEFLAEAAKLDYEIIPVSGEELQKAMEDLSATPRDVLALVDAAQTPGRKFICAEIVKDKSICGAQ